MAVPDPDAFDSRELRLKRRLLEHQFYLALGEYRATIKMHNAAHDRRDGDAARAIRPSMHALQKSIKRMKAEIDQIKELLRDHPAPIRVRKLRNLLTK